MRTQLVKPAAQEPQERRHLERLGAALAFDGWQRRFAELDVAAWTPGEHTRLAARHLVDRARAHAARHLGVAGAKLDHAATMRGPAHDLVGDAEHVHDVER